MALNGVTGVDSNEDAREPRTTNENPHGEDVNQLRNVASNNGNDAKREGDNDLVVDAFLVLDHLVKRSSTHWPLLLNMQRGTQTKCNITTCANVTKQMKRNWKGNARLGGTKLENFSELRQRNAKKKCIK